MEQEKIQEGKPLQWEELEAMIGKPVWVKESECWAILYKDDFEKDEAYGKYFVLFPKVGCRFSYSVKRRNLTLYRY